MKNLSLILKVMMSEHFNRISKPNGIVIIHCSDMYSGEDNVHIV